MDLISLESMIQSFKDGETGSLVIIFGIVLSNILTSVVTYSKSRDKKNTDVMKETLKRQSDIDEQQKLIVHNLNQEIERVKREMSEIKEESRLQKQDNREIYEKNRKLLNVISQLEFELEKHEHKYEQLEKDCSEK